MPLLCVYYALLTDENSCAVILGNQTKSYKNQRITVEINRFQLK